MKFSTKEKQEKSNFDEFLITIGSKEDLSDKNLFILI